MRTVRVAGVPALATLLALASMSAVHAAPTERAPGSVAAIGDAIAARIIAVKCNRPTSPSALTQAEIAELDSYIDERQTAFMLESKANQRLGEMVFPVMARDYNQLYSNPDACDAASRDQAKAMLERVREAQSELKKRAEVKH
ncbi:hypothetical protein [Hyphomicrobium sp. CS1GBMeth3]|uniref:hypothetical protein n=1 Tax=Hyphomicrobium sp. CS1GBMeth3 TaxID=1892845 RepID=UPI000A8FF1B0|nr:hypothetical protein [Hyphomicrobium sp. CS1GBMeth3]